jgi:hypothetical protein
MKLQSNFSLQLRLGRGVLGKARATRCLCNIFIMSAMLCCILVPIALGQTITGDIVGNVTDPSGAAVPRATVTVTNSGTQLTRTTETSTNGDYAFNLLPTGTYSVSIEAPGFKAFKLGEMPLSSGQRARVDARLEVGNLTEVVEVSGTAPLLQTDTSAVGSLITQQSIEDLPLRGRNFFAIVEVQPGVNAGMPGNFQTGARPDERRQSSSISANGQLEAWNANILDGIDNIDRYLGLSSIRPSVDSIAEIRVDTNTFSAEVGRAGGAVVNIITKSGTNDFHGSLFEFIRNDKTDANYFFNNKAGLSKPKYRQNQYGGSFGGPIIKNKTFFFVSFEQYRIVQGTPSGLMTVPTKYQLDHPGDFSDMIPGLVLPPQAIDPVSLTLFELYPEPNVPGAGTVNNYASNPVRRQTNTTLDVRFDHHFSKDDTIFGRYSYNPVSSTFPPYFPDKNGSNGVGAGFIASGNFPGSNETLAQGVQINYTHVFSPQMLMELRMGFTRLNLQSLPYHYGTNMGEKLGIPNSNYDQYSSAMPSYHIGFVYADLGDQIAIPIININNSYQYNGTVTYSRGSHNLRMGAALMRRQLNYLQEYSGQGWFWWFAPPPFSMVGFLQGTANMIQRRNQLELQYLRSWEPSTYVQDDWRATSWLTLNLGLRWDLFTPFVEKNNKYANFNVATLEMIVADSDNRTAGITTGYKNFAPRIGFAAQLGKEIVLRGGYGISFYPGDWASQINLYNVPFNPPAFECMPGTPFSPCPEGIGKVSQGPPIPVEGDVNNLSGTLFAKILNWRASYVHQFNINLQKQFGANLVSAGYVAALGRRQFAEPNVNMPPPSTGDPLPYIYHEELPNVNTIQEINNSGQTNYHAAMFTFQRRFAKGLAINGNWTWSHNLGQTGTGLYMVDPALDYGTMGQDIRHRFAVTLNYDLPFAKSMTGIGGVILKGWSVNSIAYWQSGMPFTVINAAFSPALINQPGVNSDRPDVVAGQEYLVEDATIDDCAINLKAFKVQPKGTVGSEAPNQLTGPSTRQVDFSLFKSFAIRESMKLQFRWETYNITNTANFANPNGTFTAVDANGNPTAANGFGTITSARAGSTPRQMQFALRLTF